MSDDDGLDRHAKIEADIAYLDAQQAGATTAECVGDAIRVYLKAAPDYNLRALQAIDKLDPADFKGGQDHLTLAFRETDFRAAFMRVCEIVNGTLHGTDAYERALPDVQAFLESL